jgi:hypothetical protein
MHTVRSRRWSEMSPDHRSLLALAAFLGPACTLVAVADPPGCRCSAPFVALAAPSSCTSAGAVAPALAGTYSSFRNDRSFFWNSYSKLHSSVRA